LQGGPRRKDKLFHLTGVKAWLRNQAAKQAGGRTMDGLFRYDALEAAKAG